MQVPHRPLPQYYAREADRPGWLRRLFDETAGDYDRLERLMALGSGSWYRRSALRRAGLCRGMTVLDVGVGTGLTAREAAKLVGPSGKVTGIDPSAGMMQKVDLPGIELRVGSAEALPAASASADFLSMGYALRHVADLHQAFSEFERVLAPGGRLCLLEITAPANGVGRRMLRAYMRGVMPALARWVARHQDSPKLMRYFWDTIEACAVPSVILAALEEAGFVDVRRISSLGIFSEYTARKPALT